MIVAVLGMGNLGSAIAARLAATGHEVVTWNRTPRPGTAASAREAAAAAEVVLACVRDEAASREVWLGGAVAGLRPGAVAIELSSLPPGWVRELAEPVAARGARLVEAPVAGGPGQVGAGRAHLLVGGEIPAIAVPVLDALGSRQHAGPLGTGSVLKALRNALVAVELSAMAEALAVAAAHGLGTADLREVLERGGGPASPVLLRALAGSPATPATFPAALSLKDTRVALALAAESGVPAATTSAAAGLFEREVAEGRGDRAHTSVITALT
jgi:3-hydroxyisobutyrate dehydrogenase-like beta-hydroxyacid dehydrogenase